MIQRAFSVLGNIAIVNFPDEYKSSKKKFANRILKENKAITTVLEKSGKFAGRLRKMRTKYLAGEKTKEVLYRENNCIFRFSIDETYFSPRLSNERKEIASKIKRNQEVLIMFAGVAPYSIVIAKNSKARVIYSNEINRKANKYAELNIDLNKVRDRVKLLPGDIKRVASRIKKKFDVIVMPRPQLKDTFLKEAFKLSKKGTLVHYYDFCKENELKFIIEEIKESAKKARKKIRILNKKKAGELAPYKFRFRIDFKIL